MYKSEFKVLSRDRVSNIPYKMHMFVFSWDHTLRFRKCMYLEHFKFLEYLLGVEYEGGRDADGRGSILHGQVFVMKS